MAQEPQVIKNLLVYHPGLQQREARLCPEGRRRRREARVCLSSKKSSPAAFRFSTDFLSNDRATYRWKFGT